MSDSQLKLSAFVPYILSVVSNEISQNIANLYQSQFDIDIHQWRVMAILGEETQLSAREVAKRTAMDKVAVSRAVKKLLHVNMVSRAIASDDKRRSILSLSSYGKTIYEQIVPITKDYEMALLDRLEPAEVDQLICLLAKLRQANQSLEQHT